MDKFVIRGSASRVVATNVKFEAVVGGASSAAGEARLSTAASSSAGSNVVDLVDDDEDSSDGDSESGGEASGAGASKPAASKKRELRTKNYDTVAAWTSDGSKLGVRLMGFRAGCNETEKQNARTLLLTDKKVVCMNCGYKVNSKKQPVQKHLRACGALLHGCEVGCLRRRAYGRSAARGRARSCACRRHVVGT